MTDIKEHIEAHLWNEFPQVIPQKEDEYLVTIKVTDSYSYVTIRRWGTFYDDRGHKRTTWYFYDSELGAIAQDRVIAWEQLPTPYARVKEDKK